MLFPYELKFLLTLHYLNKRNLSSKNKDISERNKVSKTNVSKVSKPLLEKHIIKKEGGWMYLTSKGEELANVYLEKYDALFYYFSTYLNLHEEIAHRDALQCSIVISVETVGNLSEVCGYEFDKFQNTR